MEEPSPAETCNAFHGSTWLQEALPMQPKDGDAQGEGHMFPSHHTVQAQVL